MIRDAFNRLLFSVLVYIAMPFVLIGLFVSRPQEESHK